MIKEDADRVIAYWEKMKGLSKDHQELLDAAVYFQKNAGKQEEMPHSAFCDCLQCVEMRVADKDWKKRCKEISDKWTPERGYRRCK